MHDTQMQFHHLTFVSERDETEVLVGRPDTESYAVFPANGVALLKRMADGMTPERAAAWHASEYGDPIDMADFLDTLDDLGFIRRPGEEATAPPQAAALRTLGRAIFSPLAFAGYAAIFLGWLFVVSRHTDLLPRPGQVFFTDSPILVQLVLIFGQVPLVFLHEESHVLAGRRLGLASSLGFGTRLYFVVFETRINGLLTVPRRKRYLPFLSGMLFDVVIICVFTLIASSTRHPDGSIPIGGRLLLALVFPALMRLSYQFLLFLQTDVYFVIATALGCNDLHAATRALIRNRIRRLRGRGDRLVDTAQWTERDLQVARWYEPFFALGVTVFTVLGVFALAPVMVQFVKLVVHGLLGHYGLHFWDSAASATLNAVQLTLFVFLTLRTRAARRRAATTAPPRPFRSELS